MVLPNNIRDQICERPSIRPMAIKNNAQSFPRQDEGMALGADIRCKRGTSLRNREIYNPNAKVIL